jgi:hypothetical protein
MSCSWLASAALETETYARTEEKASGKRIDEHTGEKMSVDWQMNERKRQAFDGSRKIRERISPR